MGDNHREHQSSIEKAVEESAYEHFMGNREEAESSSAVSTQQKELGVLQKLATAMQRDQAYRQLLLLGAFESMDAARMCVAAINERKMCGVPITPILDRVTAECAVRVGGRWGGKAMMSRVQEIIMALTHFEFNTSNRYSEQPKYDRKDADAGLLK